VTEPQDANRIGRLTVGLDRSVGRSVYRLHRWLYRTTGGAVGHRSPLGPILLLTARGRRTGRVLTVPLLYFADGSVYYVVASNGGRPENPGWLLNVRHQPEVSVQVGSARFTTIARELSGEERTQLWPQLTEFYPGWAHYQTLTNRVIAVVALGPIVVEENRGWLRQWLSSPGEAVAPTTG
jgi:F420H(2)-dependent quinone reductase